MRRMQLMILSQRSRVACSCIRGFAGGADRCSSVGLTSPYPASIGRYTIELNRPLGLVMTQLEPGRTVVDEVVEGGAAALEGSVSVGDELLATSTGEGDM